MPRSSVRKSMVWKFFDQDESKTFATCRCCQKKCKFHGNTSNLREHVKRVHPVQYQNECDESSAITFIIEPQNPSISNDIESENCVDSFNVVPQKPLKRKRQPRQKTESKKYTELSPGERASIDEAIVAMIVKDYQPLSIVDDTGFRNLVQKLNPRYTLPSRETLSEELLPPYYKSLKEKLLVALKSIHYISLTADCWKSNDNRTYLSLTAHYIFEDKLRSTNLATKEVIVTHTGTNTATVIEEICNDFNILSKIVTVVTDNTENMKKAVSDLNKHHHSCIAQTINLTVNDVLSKDSELTSVVAKCRALVTHFKQSLTHSYELKAKQIELNLPLLELQLDIPTMWNSTYLMLQRLLAVKQPLFLALANIISENSPDDLSDNEWAAMDDYLSILRPFLDITEEMSGNMFVIMSTIIPLIRGLLYAVRSITPVTQIGRTLQKALLEIIQHRLGHLESDKTVAKATFLDPRFKKAGFAHKDNARNAEQWVIEELTGIIQSKVADTECEQSDDNVDQTVTVISETVSTVSVWSLFDTQVTEQIIHETPTAAALIMVRQYIETNLINRKSDPLLYWKNHAMIFPELYQLAQKYLSVPASSVPSERIFSKSGCILNDQRNRLSSEKLEEILFLNSNIEIFS